MTVYLLHFTTPTLAPALRSVASAGVGDLDNPHGAAQHYLGYTPAGVEQRLNEHTKGIGARICAAAVQAGADLLVARTKSWPQLLPGGRPLERRLKKYKKAHKLCPLCAGDVALRRTLAPALRFAKHPGVGRRKCRCAGSARARLLSPSRG